jgi:hypothetical protein
MATLSIKNAKKPAPRWFRRMKAALLTLTVAANIMVGSWTFKDELMKTKMQLWCTVGIGAILEAFEKLLKEPDDEAETEPPAIV